MHMKPVLILQNFAVMSHSTQDVLNVLQATADMKKTSVAPFAMGEIGKHRPYCSSMFTVQDSHTEQIAQAVCTWNR